MENKTKRHIKDIIYYLINGNVTELPMPIAKTKLIIQSITSNIKNDVVQSGTRGQLSLIVIEKSYINSEMNGESCNVLSVKCLLFYYLDLLCIPSLHKGQALIGVKASWL